MWMPEFMNIQAANKLLKLIEPPKNTYFIFVSNNQSKYYLLLVQGYRINVPRLKDENISTFLEKGLNEVSSAKNIAKISKGNLNKAINSLRCWYFRNEQISVC